MPTDVVMPQMGESIAEGTIVRWIKKVGDKVDRDEPLFEISTDKVDAEIPSPAAGVVSEIRVKEGETVAVNSVVAVIGQAGEAVAAKEPMAADAKPAQPPKPSAQGDGAPASAPAAAQGALAGQAASPTTEDAIRQRSSPLVRKIAQEHNVDISHIQGSGIAGRVTKEDIRAYVAGQNGQERREGQEGRQPAAQKPAAPPFKPGASDRVEKMSVMRKKIAEHMIVSRRTSAHVHSVFEVNFGRIAQIRQAKKAEYERAGVKLTYLSFIVKAAVDALRDVPIVNASIDGENVVYHKDINVGIAVALDWGLIVPVVKNAGERNLLGLSKAIADLAARARSKQLKPDEVTGGTFTITNPGVFGALFGTPIINQPQVAILGVGNIEKRAVVIDDAIAIRPMAYLTLGYDHRLIDGVIADEYMSHVKRALENWDPAQA
jgi:2-oxoglutarate dehydrogenase E2 component (dihydrolipoamide succinyltransferase)